MNLLLAFLSPIFVYVANQASGKVTVIDAATDSVVAIVDFTALGFSAHPKPHHIVVEPDGSYWYVSLVGDNAVEVGGERAGADRRDQSEDDDAGRSRSAGAQAPRARGGARRAARVRREPR